MLKSTNSIMDDCSKSLQLPNNRSHYKSFLKTNMIPVAKFALLIKSLVLLITLFVGISHQQSSISLNNAEWFVANSNRSIFVPAQVPGGIYSDLRRNEILKQDILFGKNDIAYRWVGNENWTYSATFAIDHQIGRSQSVKLVLNGIDTVATIYLNDYEIGTTDNMFVRYRFEVKSHLKLPGLKNNLVIKFESPVKYSARKSNQSIRQNRGRIIPPYCPSPAQRGECHVNFIRKMQSSFSWDWGPAFPSVGLYKNVELEFGSFGIIRDILVETRNLPPLVQTVKDDPPPPQLIISSSIRHQVRTPTVNRTMPYIRAPPYYLPFGSDHKFLDAESPLPVLDMLSHNDARQPLVDENWLLKATLVAEMVKPSFGYNLKIEFNLNNVLQYESEHINVVANSDGFIRLGFNLRIDPSRLKVKPWWPNNAGGQTLYQLSARMMPIPNPAASVEQTNNMRMTRQNHQLDSNDSSDDSTLQSRIRPGTSSAGPHLKLFLAGHTDPNTYRVQYISEKEISFGFRTVELIQEPIATGDINEGLTFNFRINGVDLFAMGSNWIPSHVLPEYSNNIEHIRYLLQSAKDANMNMLRVWGGGIYESDEFYKIADEMGIMIWHDFMFACALYPVDDDFLSTVRLEIEQQVQRLQYHPSIVLWAGNNENEMAIAGPWWPEVTAWNKRIREMYSQLYVDTIKKIVQILDPTRPFVESSPSNGVLSTNQPYAIARLPNDNKFGDVHHYDYWADSFEWTSYPSTRFASEYGFQSYPSFNALTSVTVPNDWKYPLTPNILHRQHRLTGELEIKHQIKLHFKDIDAGGADKLKTFIYVSQLTQAIAIKTETEFYRRNRFINGETKLGKTMGALYWQLNDVWQAPSWSSIEFGGKWKMLHYFARRFFFPIQVVPYITQHGAGPSSSQISNISSTLTNINYQHHFNDHTYSEQQQQSAGPTPGSMLAIDLIRDDLFYLLDSFNVTIRLYRWTSFVPIWQDYVYVKYARPQNVTRIYEIDMTRLMRQSGLVSLSSGVVLVTIEQQPRQGLSQIENYLMPVTPTRITAMRVARISVELIQGPFQLTDVRLNDSGQVGTGAASQWACAYRLTLVSDAIAMFVWLDLNLLNIATLSNNGENHPSPTEVSPMSSERNLLRPAPENIHLGSLPPGVLAAQNQHQLPHDRIRIHNFDQQLNSKQDQLDDANLMSDRNNNLRSQRQLVDDPLEMKRAPQQVPPYKTKDVPGYNNLRYQFSDNAFNMLEPTKIIDLYLSRCLTKAQMEVALEIQKLADVL